MRRPNKLMKSYTGKFCGLLGHEGKGSITAVYSNLEAGIRGISRSKFFDAFQKGFPSNNGDANSNQLDIVQAALAPGLNRSDIRWIQQKDILHQLNQSTHEITVFDALVMSDYFDDKETMGLLEVNTRDQINNITGDHAKRLVFWLLRCSTHEMVEEEVRSLAFRWDEPLSDVADRRHKANPASQQLRSVARQWSEKEWEKSAREFFATVIERGILADPKALKETEEKVKKLREENENTLQKVKENENTLQIMKEENENKLQKVIGELEKTKDEAQKTKDEAQKTREDFAERFEKLEKLFQNNQGQGSGLQQ